VFVGGPGGTFWLTSHHHFIKIPSPIALPHSIFKSATTKLCYSSYLVFYCLTTLHPPATMKTRPKERSATSESASSESVQAQSQSSYEHQKTFAQPEEVTDQTAVKEGLGYMATRSMAQQLFGSACIKITLKPPHQVVDKVSAKDNMLNFVDTMLGKPALKESVSNKTSHSESPLHNPNSPLHNPNSPLHDGKFCRGCNFIRSSAPKEESVQEGKVLKDAPNSVDACSPDKAEQDKAKQAEEAKEKEQRRRAEDKKWWEDMRRLIEVAEMKARRRVMEVVEMRARRIEKELEERDKKFREEEKRLREKQLRQEKRLKQKMWFRDMLYHGPEHKIPPGHFDIMFTPQAALAARNQLQVPRNIPFDLPTGALFSYPVKRSYHLGAMGRYGAPSANNQLPRHQRGAARRRTRWDN
jgi:hypothetical protein